MCVLSTTFLTAESTLQPGLLHTRGMAASGLRPLCNIPHCCLRRSLDRVSVPVADHPLRPARDRRLGEPLPHQLANPGHILTREARRSPCLSRSYYTVLAIVSNGYPPHQQFPRHYSPVRRSTPLSSPEGSNQLVSARLACVRPAASVQSEP